MKHRVYMRDWYFNAGIIGFLIALADGKSLNDIENIVEIKDNYIEFDDNVFDGFEEKYTKNVFLNIFDISYYKSKLVSFLKQLTEQEKLKINDIKKELEKTEMKNFLDVMGFSYDLTDKEKLSSSLEKIISIISVYTNEKALEIILSKDKGKDFIENYLNLKTEGIFAYKKILEFIKSIKEYNYNTKLKKNNDKCIFCQNDYRKSSEDLSNAISNIIGFNARNSNWVWGYKSSNIKLCSLCAFIYCCAFISFTFVNKRIGEGKEVRYINYLYFLNYNSSIKENFNKIIAFKILLQKDNDKPFMAMIKESIQIIKKEQVKNIKQNISFTEIIESSLIKPNSSGIKTYNVFNYNIAHNTAEFLNSKFDKNEIPKGFYRTKDKHYNIDEELLLSVINNRLGYIDANNYLSIYVSKSVKEKDKSFSPYKITTFILDYINNFRRNMEGMENKTVAKGFTNGRNLRDRIIGEKKENQINGIVYGFLNDLRISDREKFLDKYIRLSMSYDMKLSFGKDEMEDIDNFLQFGYSFVNGLLYKEYEKPEEKESK